MFCCYLQFTFCDLQIVGVQVVGRIGEDTKVLSTSKRIEDTLWGEGVGLPASLLTITTNNDDANSWR